MLKVGITGQTGFIGTHLYNFLNLNKEEIQTIPFADSYFENADQLNGFVTSCDAIVHLAAMNRHSDPQEIYDTNLKLIRKLIAAMEVTDSHPHVLFSSSTQEERDNLYGKSKHDGRILLTEWAERTKSRFTGLVIPNVFGPFGAPYYNSVIATFCHQLTHNEQPKIMIDADLELIYVGELVELIYREITNPSIKSNAGKLKVSHTSKNKVSEILEILENHRDLYFKSYSLPYLRNKFELNLFNTFRSYFDHSSHFPVKLKKNVDHRGVFTETVKTSIGGQFSFSMTVPGVTRGNHFHTRKIERFIVIKGKALIELRRIGKSEVLSFELDGEEPSFVDMPVWYTHNIKNVGEEELITLFWINEFFNPDDPDTYFENV